MKRRKKYRIRFIELIKISRPLSWIIFPLVFYGGLYLGKVEISPIIVLILFSLSFPFCLFGYGINDVYDYKTDIKNPRKKSIVYGCVVYPTYRKFVKKISILSILPLIFFVILTKNSYAILICFVLILLGYFYSAPPIRLKEKPPFDSISNGLIYFLLPFSLGYSLSGSFINFPLFQVLLLTLCVSAIHAIGTIMDYNVDKSVGIKTFAVKYGKRNTAIFAFFVFLLTSIIGDFGRFEIIIKSYLLFCSFLCFLLFFIPNEEFAMIVFKMIFIGFLFAVSLCFLLAYEILKI